MLASAEPLPEIPAFAQISAVDFQFFGERIDTSGQVRPSLITARPRRIERAARRLLIYQTMVQVSPTVAKQGTTAVPETVKYTLFVDVNSSRWQQILPPWRQALQP
jgi:hypothetical protein